MKLLFQPPADNQRGPVYLEGLIAGWSSMCGRGGLSLGLMCRQGRLSFVLDIPDSRQRTIASQLANAFPGSKVEVLPETADTATMTHRWLRLSPDVLPLVLHDEFVEQHTREAVDPLEQLLEAIKAGRSGRVTTELWLHVTPARPRIVDRVIRLAPFVSASHRSRWRDRTFRRLCSGRGWRQRCLVRLLSWFLPRDRDLSPAIAAKLNQHLLEVRLKLTVTSPTKGITNRQLNDVQSALTQFTTGEVSFFEAKEKQGSFQLTAAEVATLWHPPIQSVQVPRVERSTFREAEPPAGLASREGSDGAVTLGRVCFRHERQRVVMDLDARRRHLLVIGKTGCGKSTLLQNMIAEDIAAGRGCALIEPHGDLATTTLDLIPRRRTNDVVVFDPADTAFSVAFNPLQVPPGGDATLVADGVLAAFQKVFGLEESNAPRLLHIFRNCLLSLVETPGTSLLSVQRLLLNAAYRKTVIGHVSNPVVRSFWIDEFEKWKPQDRTAFVASLQNKLGAFLTNDKLQSALGQPHGKLNLRQVMDERKILIANLSKGRLGENASDLLGTLLVTSLQIAAMSRADVAEDARPDFSIVLDEFQNVATPAIATFLSESRKYRTQLVLSHQFAAQLDDSILAAVLGNVGSMLVFQLGAEDAELFARQLGGQITADNLMNVPRYHAYCRLLIDGKPSAPFSIRTIPPNWHQYNRGSVVCRRSQRTYARPAHNVDALIRQQLG